MTTPVTFDLVPPPAPAIWPVLRSTAAAHRSARQPTSRSVPLGTPRGRDHDQLCAAEHALRRADLDCRDQQHLRRAPLPHRLSVHASEFQRRRQLLQRPASTATAPLSVTRCSSLSYSPEFSVTATRDSADSQVKLSTQVTQGAGQSPSRSGHRVPDRLCSEHRGWGPLPERLERRPYPSGQSLRVRRVSKAADRAGVPDRVGPAPSLTLVFPSPFPLTLIGRSTWSQLDDIHRHPRPAPDEPTGLANGGAGGLFKTTCAPPSATATAILTDQNGDKTVDDSSRFTVGGCSASGSGAGASLTAVRVSGLASGRPSLSFKVRVVKGGRKHGGSCRATGRTRLCHSGRRKTRRHHARRSEHQEAWPLARPPRHHPAHTSFERRRQAQWQPAARARVARAGGQATAPAQAVPTVVAQNTKARRDTIRAPIANSGDREERYEASNA